eukprot:78041_1
MASLNDSVSSEQKDGVEKAMEAVLSIKCQPMPKDSQPVKGYDFNKGIDYAALMKAYKVTGFQASHMGQAVDRINEMIHWRLSDDPVRENDPTADPEKRKHVRCKVFLGLTSNMISSGTRECIRYLVEHKMVDYIVTTGGGIEEDFMKCFKPHYMGSFESNGRDLRMKGHNRIGNLIVPNDNYCDFENWLTPILDAMWEEQEKEGTVWSPSKIIRRLGKEIDNPESVWYWAYKNDIPVFCPAITDGSIGDMLFFRSFQKPGFIVDIVSDLKQLNQAAIDAPKTGMVILGGGLVKHHICNANLMRNGADFSVFINTGQEFDGSDAGARPDEAVSWGKIRLDAKPVKVYGDATFIFPLIVAQTFALHKEKASKLEESEESR